MIYPYNSPFLEDLAGLSLPLRKHLAERQIIHEFAMIDGLCQADGITVAEHGRRNAILSLWLAMLQMPEEN